MTRSKNRAKNLAQKRRFWTAYTYVIDESARQHGHEVIRTPPYHPELQPIEMCWDILKNEVARHCDFTLEYLKRQSTTTRRAGGLSVPPRGGRLFEEPPEGGKPKTVQNLSFQDNP